VNSGIQTLAATAPGPRESAASGVGSTMRLDEPASAPATSARTRWLVGSVGLLAVACVVGAGLKMATRTEEAWPRGTLPIGSLPERVGDPVASAPPMVIESPWGRMMRIEGGPFTMGALDGDPDERPPHEETVASFELDETEVTVASYARCVKEGACREAGHEKSCNGHVAGRDQHPINCVDWTQAAAFCQHAGKRLPSEKEWEYTARGGKAKFPYPWGSGEPTTQLCWNRSDTPTNGGTCAVGSFPSGRSRQGVLDLAGNVWEWTASPHTKDYTREAGYPSTDCSPVTDPDAGSAPGDGCSGRARVARGGGWGDTEASDLRSANRSRLAPEDRSPRLGFRCARTP
jgi:formylglycine-generating enzyme required for sulfatase activity